MIADGLEDQGIKYYGAANGAGGGGGAPHLIARWNGAGFNGELDCLLW